MPNIFTEKVMYLCDPHKNYKCPKTSCHVNTGEGYGCRCTRNVEFAKTYENGEPIIDSIYINGVLFKRTAVRLRTEN